MDSFAEYVDYQLIVWLVSTSLCGTLAKRENNFMPVVISPNIKKESVRIDPAGNVINPRTKQIIKPVEPEYVPPITQPSTTVPPVQPTATPIENKVSSKIDEMINKKIEELVAKKIEEALSKL